MGSAFVNDFNLFGRAWQVRMTAEEDFRDQVDDILRVHVRSATGAMVPIGAFASVDYMVGPMMLQRYNNTRSATISGNPAPDVSSGTALAAMEAVATASLRQATRPHGRGLRWRKSMRRDRRP